MEPPVGTGTIGGPDMPRDAARTGLCVIMGAALLVLNFSSSSRAQLAVINDLRGKIFDAKMLQETFLKGLTHCSEFDGTNFYFEQRDRVLNLQDYHRALNSLAQGGIFNPETKKPWDQSDADKHWAQAQQLAAIDKANCALVASLPDMQKQLAQLQQAAAAAPGAAPANNK
jgi:hypothetical protein